MEIPIADDIIVAISKLIDDSQVTSREPTHSDLDFYIKKASLLEGDPKHLGQTVGKAKRLRATLSWALEYKPRNGSKLIHSILSLIKASGGFRENSQNFVGKEEIKNMINILDFHGIILSEHGDLHTKTLENLSGKNLTLALKSYANRAKQGSEDAALLSGTGKDLLEATAKHIIQTKFGSHTANANFPTLMGQAYAALEMTTPETPKQAGESAIKDYERALFKLATSINIIRNKEGTGHGRIYTSNLNNYESHNIIQAVGIITEFLLNRLEEN
ncbi:abortive infection family protein [Acinetobacter sp. NIPH 1852]|uniref:abortive infection family protein n=1 Tax=Acinetobacter sp. NIPH 1852 TaxID=2923428 RepID=UPI001F4B23A6|nr:abortive infection family protein [Acinetobacter sp. NIPH 1852]MCH7306534.1 abortive infection family protein [Acinetobacter sp. NIPH 1852]